jgi:DNA-binding NtrC family response regulator
VIGTIVSSSSLVPSFSETPTLFFSAEVESQSRSVNAKVQSRRILVIDDEASIADSLAEILTSHGFEARAFYAGQKAVDYAREQCPDIVLSDVVMPKLNGVDTVLALREICPSIRIFLFSGQAGTGNILQRARANGHEFELLPKPLHPDKLLKKLRS